MSYSILKQGPLTKKPIFFLIGGFIAVTIFFTVLFSLKEQDKIKKIEFYKSADFPTVFNVIMKEKPEPCYFRDLWRKYDLDKKIWEKYKLEEEKKLLDVFLSYDVESSEISGKFSKDKCLDEMTE